MYKPAKEAERLFNNKIGQQLIPCFLMRLCDLLLPLLLAVMRPDLLVAIRPARSARAHPAAEVDSSFDTSDDAYVAG